MPRKGDARTGRLAARLVAVLLLAVAGTLPSPAAHAGEAPILRVEAAALWALEEGADAVAVRIDFTITNLQPDLVTDDSVTSYWFETFRVALPSEAREVRAEANGTPLSAMTVTSEPTDDLPAVLSAVVALPEELHYLDTQTLSLHFELPGSPPRSESRTRVNPAYAAFDARAWGEAGMSSVEVRIADVFEVTTFGADVPVEQEDGYTVFRQSDIDEPGSWYLFISARNDAALDAEALDVPDLDVTVRSWPGDTDWATGVRNLVEEGLPLLRDLISLDYGPTEMVDVLQARDPSLLGFAGWYLIDLDRIELGETVDAHVVLHELTHLWFNQRLFAERWINEGLAEVYATAAIEQLGLNNTNHVPSRPADDDPARVPLTEWALPTTPPSRDDTIRNRELFGYNASSWVLATITNDIGLDGMAMVIAAADAGEMAYLSPGHTPEPAPERRVDWRRFLDLIEERTGTTTAETMYRGHVLTTAQAAELDDRSEARQAYEPLRDSGLGIPLAVRLPMSQWQFAEAMSVIATAVDTTERLDSIGRIVSPIGLSVPQIPIDAYESAIDADALLSARDLTVVYLHAAEAVAEADAAVAAPRSLITWLGLLGAAPEEHLEAARTAFQAQDATSALAEATVALDLLDAATDAGRLRAFWVGGAVLVIIGLGTTWTVVSWRRGRRTAPVS